MTPHPDRPTDASSRGEHRRPPARQPGHASPVRPHGGSRPHEPTPHGGSGNAVAQADGEP